MPALTIPIGNGFYISDSTAISNQECVNWYVNNPQVEGALSQATLFGGAGIEQLLTTGAIKQAVLETGASINVPLFINVGDELKIDTRTNSYVERVKS